MPEHWRVELSRTAVTALRALPRAEQRRVARRIEELEQFGLPRMPGGDPGGSGAVAVPIGDHVLFCLERADGVIVIVTLGAELAAATPTVAGLVRYRLRRWMRKRLGGEGMESFRRDFRFAFRSLRRSPGFAVTAVLTLALGIGATAAIFSVADGVLLKPLPYGDADRVVTIWSSWSNFPDRTWVSESEFQNYYQQNRTLEDLGLYFTFNVNFTDPDNPERVGAAGTTSNIFSVLGVQPVMGRVYTDEEAETEQPVIMLGYDAWQRRFGGDPSVVGRDVEVNGTNQTVVGVLPQGFVLPVDYASPSVSEVFYPYYVDLGTPAQVPLGGGSHGSYLTGRMRPGETAATVLADLEGLVDRLAADGIYTPDFNFHARVYPVKADVVGTARGTILVLMGAVGFVLLIACGNVANLLLSRSEVRAREVAVRTALGAGRARILRQLLTESLVLAMMAGVLGLGFGALGVDALLQIDPDAVPRAASVSMNWTVALFTLAVSVLTAAVFGAVPALRTSAGSMAGSLRDGDRAGRGDSRSHRMQGLLVATQMAMAVILLTGSGLMIKTFVGLLRVDPGFHAEDVLTMRVTAPSGTYPEEADVRSFYEELLRRLRELPGVRRAGAARLLPLASQMGDAGFRPVWYQPGPNEFTQADWQWVTPDYVEVMGIPLLAGRTFDEGDGPDAQSVVMINESLARRYWGDESPLGSAMVGMGGDTAVVVGVLGDVAHNSITGQAKDRFYRAHAQIEGFVGTMRSMTLTIATDGDPHLLIEPVRREIRALNPSMPVSEIQTMDEVLSHAVAQPRFAMVLLAAFGALALTLSVVGIYGVLAYAVSRRTREIGVRMALGARATDVTRLVVRQGMAWALTGVTLGTLAAFLLSDLMSGLLYRVSPQDPLTFVAVPVAFAAVALLACWIPAARAARVRPAHALRWE